MAGFPGRLRNDALKFTPLVSFYDDDLKSHYCDGLTYTVRPGNEVLAGKVRDWLDSGKVRIVDAAELGPVARLSGRGSIN